MDIDSQAAEIWSRAMKAESHAEWADRRIDELEEALHSITEWVDAYPTDIFPEPDWNKARDVLKVADISLDAITAGVQRRMLFRIKEIAAVGRLKAAPQKD